VDFLWIVAIFLKEVEDIFKNLERSVRNKALRWLEGHTSDPPWTPSFIQPAPYLDLSSEMEVAWPPVTSMRSIMVTLKFLGCWARVAAHDCCTFLAVVKQAGQGWGILYIYSGSGYQRHSIN
jgi:hypothetical protein